MKRFLFFIVLLTSMWVTTFAQQTTMTVDCQTPGWLSSKINYGDQKTVENLTVTGYLNTTDVKFLRELNLNRSLHGILDLSQVNFVSGGETITIDGSKFSSNEDKIPQCLLYGLLPLKKVILPKEQDFCAEGLYAGFQVQIDTLVAYGKTLRLGNIIIKDLHISEGISEVYLGNVLANSPSITLVLPSSLKKLSCNWANYQNETNIISYITDPKELTIQKPDHYLYDIFVPGKLYVPKGCKELYNMGEFSNYYSSGNIIEMVDAEKITIDETALSLYAGDCHKMNATIQPENALNKAIKWKSLNENIATLNENGVVTAKSYGKTKIIAETVNHLQASCDLNVYEHTQKIDLEKQVRLNVGQSHKLEYKTLPTETTDGKVYWATNNPRVATIDKDGNITAIAQGTCDITATSIDNVCSTTCTVTVLQPITKIEINSPRTSINVGNSIQLFAKISPENAENKAIIWHSSNNEVATVKEGLVYAKKAGISTITVSSVENENIKDECIITVLQPVTGLKLDKESAELELGKTLLLTATVLPEDASNKNIKWLSSKPEVCQVTNKGMLVALKEGTSVIMATTEDGEYVATCLVTVSSSTGIENITDTQAKLVKYYDLNGSAISSPQVGKLYIVKYADGTVKKAIFGK